MQSLKHSLKLNVNSAFDVLEGYGCFKDLNEVEINRIKQELKSLALDSVLAFQNHIVEEGGNIRRDLKI